ncbi:BTAD domain-containing putative transcriptional regulator [Streptomyces sp. NPDC086081]|uniref:BTAD domain-containing putative transcriptional regulator n=1 Tax=Streptomyces sp. NPDC086081 TaxID=3365749 RepID=UPI00382BE6AD
MLYQDVPGGTGDGVASGATRAVGIGSPKSRALLAALLLDAGRVVSVESLKDALWGEAPPVSAQASLHNHVARVRRLLDDPGRLLTTPSGYLLRVDEGELDVHVFDAQVAAARAAHARRDGDGVLRACAAALGLWRGAPLAGLPPEVGGYGFAQRLRETRLLLLEWRYDAELALGGPRLHGLVPELAALTGEYPLREVFHRQLMLALHRTGRRAESLAVHRDLRTRLVDQLGVEPGPGVRAAHVEVLREAAGNGARRRPTGSNAAERGERGPVAPGVQAVGVGGPGVQPGGIVAPGVQPDGIGGPGVQAVGVGGPGVQPGGIVAPGVQAAGVGGPGVEEDEGVAGQYGTGVEGRVPAVPGALREPAPDAPQPGEYRPDAATAWSPPPAQLPPPSAHFIGRTPEREALRRLLTGPGPRPTAVISGMPGIGKSALALRLAHDLAERFSDGQLHLDLRGATPGATPLPPGRALTALLRDLGVEPCRIPESPDAASALLRSLLARTRTLLVLDGAVSAAQVRPLLPGGAGCAVIVTSWFPLTALDGAARFPLAPLSHEESIDLLRAASGRAGLDGADAARLLVERTGRLPLALRVVAARLAARRALTPEALAAELSRGDSRLRHLEYDDLSVRRSLAGAYDALAASPHQTDRDAALALRRIGALDLPDYGAPLLARLTGTGVLRTEAALGRLVEAALLEETAYGRYAPHPLVRDLARDLARDMARDPARDPARNPARDPASGQGPVPDPVDAALRWYAAEAERVAAAIGDGSTGPAPDPGAAHRCRPAAPASPVTSPASPDDAFAWADVELANVIELVRRHVGDPCGERAILVSTLARLLLPCARGRGRTTEAELLERAARHAGR